MNRSIRLALLAALPLSALGFSPRAHPKPAPKAKVVAPMTVLDYFKLLPHRYTRVPASALLREPHDPPFIDQAVGYMEVTARDSSVTIIASLLRLSGRATIAVYSEHERFSFDLLRFENGKWKNVTRALIPRLSKDNVYLPERGQPLVHVFQGEQGEVIYERGRFLYDLAWRGGRFSVVP